MGPAGVVGCCCCCCPAAELLENSVPTSVERDFSVHAAAEASSGRYCYSSPLKLNFDSLFLIQIEHDGRTRGGEHPQLPFSSSRLVLSDPNRSRDHDTPRFSKDVQARDPPRNRLDVE